MAADSERRKSTASRFQMPYDMVDRRATDRSSRATSSTPPEKAGPGAKRPEHQTRWLGDRRGNELNDNASARPEVRPENIQFAIGVFAEPQHCKRKRVVAGTERQLRDFTGLQVSHEDAIEEVTEN